MEAGAREPVSRRGRSARPALSRAAIIDAGLEVAGSEGVDAVTMRRIADKLDTSASALYVYIRGRQDLLDAMFDHVMAAVAETATPEGTWQERLGWLLIASVEAAGGHGGLAQVALSRIPAGPSAQKITAEVGALLAEGQVSEAAIPGALDLLGLFVTAAALDRVPAAFLTPAQQHDRLRWQIDVILNGLVATAPVPPRPASPRRDARRRAGPG
jgi:AcrR family transcriptional regulator